MVLCSAVDSRKYNVMAIWRDGETTRSICVCWRHFSSDLAKNVCQCPYGQSKIWAPLILSKTYFFWHFKPVQRIIVSRLTMNEWGRIHGSLILGGLVQLRSACKSTNCRFCILRRIRNFYRVVSWEISIVFLCFLEYKTIKVPAANILNSLPCWTSLRMARRLWTPLI